MERATFEGKVSGPGEYDVRVKLARSSIVVPSALVLFRLVAACTEVKEQPSGDGGTITLEDGAVVPVDDAGNPILDGGGGASDGASTITDFGSVSVSYYDLGVAKSFQSFAQFTKATGAVPALPTCQSEVAGDCTSYVCGPAPAQDAGPTVDAGKLAENAGVITISGAKIPAGTTLTPGATGAYAPLTRSDLDAWAGGETIKVSAAGGSVPAFTGDVVAPSPASSLTSPVLAAAPAKTEIERGRPLPVTWSGATAGTIGFTLAATSGGGSVTVQCRFDASKGAGSVPASLLAKLPASDGSLGTSITSNTLVKAGSYNVSLVATSFVKSGAGQVTFK